MAINLWLIDTACISSYDLKDLLHYIHPKGIVYFIHVVGLTGEL